jgi:hypothetical protein
VTPAATATTALTSTPAAPVANGGAVDAGAAVGAGVAGFAEEKKAKLAEVRDCLFIFTHYIKLSNVNTGTYYPMLSNDLLTILPNVLWSSQVKKSIAELVEGPHKTACLKTKMDINRTVQQIAGTLETVPLFRPLNNTVTTL